MKPIQYTISAVDRATATIDKISNRIERLSQPFSQLERSIKRFGNVSGINRLAKGISWLTTKMMSLLGVVLKLGAPLLALFGGGTILGIYNMTEGWARLNSTISNTSQIMGVSSQKLMNWRGVGDLVGISADTMTKGLEGFQQTLQDAKWGRNQAVFGMLQMLGITLKQTKDGVIDTEAVLYQLADRIQKIQKKDPAAARRLADSMGVTELLPVLMNGSKAMRSYQMEVKRLQGEITPAMTDKASNFALSIRKMRIAAEGTKAAIADKLIPVFQPLVDKWTEFLQLNREKISTKIAELAERLANWLEKIDFEETLKGINKFVDGCVSIVKWTNRAIDRFSVWSTWFSVIGSVFEFSVLGKFQTAYKFLTWIYDKLKQIFDVSSKQKIEGPEISGSSTWKKTLSNILGFNFSGSGSSNSSGSNLSNNPVSRAEATASKYVAPTAVERAKSQSLLGSLESRFGLSKGLLDRQWFAESRRGKTMFSPAGATGHFQFMPATATRFGLSRTDTFDFNKSALAAARYMSWLKKRYKGNERLAAMAYNWGEGNVDSYIKTGHGIKTRRNPSGTVPQETRGYIEKVLGSGNSATSATQQNPINVSVNTTVHPNGATVTKVETPQGVKVSHNRPGQGYGS